MLTEGALMLAVFAVLMFLSVYVPVIAFITSLFLILPFLLYSAKHPLKHAFLILIGAIAMSAIINIMFVPIAILYGTTGLVMGYCIRSGKSKLISYMASSMVFLGNIVLFYIAAVILLEINLMDELIKSFRSSGESYAELMKSLGQVPNEQVTQQIEEMIKLLKALAPSLLIGVSFLTVILLMAVNFPILKRVGVNVPQFSPFRTLKFPRSILWYYLITIIISLVADLEEGTYLYMVVMNGTYILQMILFIQGLAFIFYYSYLKSWPKAIPIMATVMTFLWPIFFSIVKLLGIIDLGFDLRERLAKK
ncbi:hypothetical protein BLX87_13240 [Bacillus sp. VT-16-64]|nr:hypothetical protein BLX87_13240 [Bacillus sp. VT-16-64]